MNRAGLVMLGCLTLTVVACTTGARNTLRTSSETGNRYGRDGVRTILPPPKPFNGSHGTGTTATHAPVLETEPPTSAPVSDDGRPVVYLTFDDGPTPGYTNPILDTLKARDVQATFFVLGKMVERHPNIVSRMVADGHSVQNHTYNHLDADNSTAEQFGFDVFAASTSIEKHTGTAPACIRPPYGSRPDLVQLWTGLPTVMWDIDPKDWRKGSLTTDIVNHVVTNVFDGAVVLLHDGGGDRDATAAAVGPIVDTLHAAGYRFATMCT